MNTATGTKGSKRLNAEGSRKLKLVPRSSSPPDRKKLRIGIGEGLFSPRPKIYEKSPASSAPTSLHEAAAADMARGGAGKKWIAIAAIGLVLGFLVGSRRK